MFNISIPIDDYIDKTFFIKKEELIILPKRKDEKKKMLNLSMDLDDNKVLKSIDDDILTAISDGFVNGYIESHKDITKELLILNYSYDDIIDITGLTLDSIKKIENEL